jgi:hypothetical protein
MNITSQYDQIALLNFQRIQEENSEILKNAQCFSKKKYPYEGWNPLKNKTVLYKVYCVLMFGIPVFFL